MGTTASCLVCMLTKVIINTKDSILSFNCPLPGSGNRSADILGQILLIWDSTRISGMGSCTQETLNKLTRSTLDPLNVQIVGRHPFYYPPIIFPNGIPLPFCQYDSVSTSSIVSIGGRAIFRSLKRGRGTRFPIRV